MIHTETFYVCHCDNCGEHYGNDEYTVLVMPDESAMKAELGDTGDWHTVTEKGQLDKHYCPNCFEFDDNDQLIIKPKKS